MLSKATVGRDVSIKPLASLRVVLLDFVDGQEQNCEDTVSSLRYVERRYLMVFLHNNHIIQDISGRIQHSDKTGARDHKLTRSLPSAVAVCSRKVASSSDSVEHPC